MEEQSYKLKKLLNELAGMKGRHTELVSVYIPKDYPIYEIMNLIATEISLTQNVKSKAVRKNVTDALTKIQQQLKLYKRTPEHGLAIFCGNISEHEGDTDIKIWAIEPPEPVPIKLYWCDQKFELGPLMNMVAEKEIYGLVVMDVQECTIGLLKGKAIQVLRHMDSIVPGKTGKGGQCQPEGTLVFAADGRLIPIEKISEEIPIKSADFSNFKIEDSIVLDVFKTNKSDIVKIITKYPRFEVQSSKEHFFFVYENGEVTERAASELKVGDFLLIPEKVNVSGEIQKLSTNFNSYGSEITLPSELDENTAQILGYFIGDGNFDVNRICFSEQRKKLAEFYKKKIEEKFNINVGMKFRSKKNYYELKAYSKTLLDFFRSELIGEKKSLSASMPDIVLKSPNNVLAGFLRGLYDAEGYISGRVGLGTFSETLARHIQLSLMRFGILSSLLEYDSRKNPYSKNHRFTIEISEKSSLKTFSEKIGFSSERKSEALKKLIDKKTDKSSVRQILTDGRRIRKILEENGYNKQFFIGAGMFLLGKRNISKQAFEKHFLNKKISDELRNKLLAIYDCNILPAKISKIETIQKEVPMVDLAVKHQNFISNGILVHNSAQRYERVREGLTNDWLKMVAENVRAYLGKPEIKGIIFGGSGPLKNTFLEEGYLLTEVKKKIIGVQDTGYTDEHGLSELVERAGDLLKEASVAKEKALMQKFLAELQKNSGLVVYGAAQVIHAVEAGAVDILLVSEKFSWPEFEFICEAGHAEKRFCKPGAESEQACKECGKKMKIIGQKDPIDAIEELAKTFGTKIEIVSVDTGEGQKLEAIGGIGAILRYKFEG